MAVWVNGVAEPIRVNGYIVPRDLLYTETDEWVRVGSSGVAVVGVTDYAQKELRDVVGVELPEVGYEASRGEAVASIESVKTVADVYSPLSGVIVEVNERLYEEPELINRDPYGEGWIFKIRYSDSGELEALLSPEQYAEKIRERKH